MLRSIAIPSAPHCSLSQPNTFIFFDRLSWDAKAECIPFTVFTKTCFSLLGSFSSTRTPWKMRPNVPVRDKKQFYLKEKGQERQSQRHQIQMSPLLQDRYAWLICGERWTGLGLTTPCLLMWWGRFGFCSWEGGQKESFSSVKRTFHHRQHFGNTSYVKSRREHLRHSLCLNCHPVASEPLWGKKPPKSVNHQRRPGDKNLSPEANGALCFDRRGDEA